MKITLANTIIDLTPTGKSYRATVGEETVEVEVLRAENGHLDLLIGGERFGAYVSSDNAKCWVTINGRTVMLAKQSASRTDRLKGIVYLERVVYIRLQEGGDFKRPGDVDN